MLNLRTAVAATRNLRYLAEAASRIWRVLRALFQEVVGFVFLVLAAWGALWLVKSFQKFNGEGEALFKMAVVAIFVVMMGGFGVSSFRNARRISREKS
jgi:hypothetical protein